MRITAIVPYKFWHHAPTGRRASIYGAHPASSESERANWELKTEGYTWQCDDGTSGLGRKPANTLEEAEMVMRRFNNLND